MDIGRLTQDGGGGETRAVPIRGMANSMHSPHFGRSTPLDIPSRRVPSPTSSRGSVPAPVMAEIPPLLPLTPQFPPADTTMAMDWRPQNEESRSRQHGRNPFDTRTAFSEGTGVWGGRTNNAAAAVQPISQSHNDVRVQLQFEKGLDLGGSRREYAQPKQLRESLLKSQLEQNSLVAYDNEVLRKLDGFRSLGRTSNPPSPHNHHADSNFDERRLPSTSAVQIPKSDSYNYKPHRLSSGREPEPFLMAVAPTANPPVFPPVVAAGGFPSRFGARRSPTERCDDLDEHPMRKSPSFSWSGDADIPRPVSRSRSSQDYAESENELQMDDVPGPQLKELTIRDNPLPSSSLPRLGTKRRASSPIAQNRLTVSQSEPGRRQDGYNGDTMRRSPVVGNGTYAPSRLSPQSSQKYHNLASRGPSSLLSTSSSVGSPAWSVLGASSSISTASSIQSVSDASFNSPRDVEMAEGLAPSAMTQRRSFLNGDSSLSRNSRKSASEMPQQRTHMPKFNGRFICECCPKKPKKFGTAEELAAHELEKQHICQFCHNRFKNKNEAERHQNSLHLRKHSWSCAALTSTEDAFHRNKTDTGDICGYCGVEFPLPADWNVRANHLTTEHKFGECNQTKKFFRADHFRQHLKHSHSGTSGKWTNVLENACMREEPQPEPLSIATSPARSTGENAD